MSARSASNSMLTNEVFRARAFRLALAFCFAISVATAAAFGFIYLQVSTRTCSGWERCSSTRRAKSEGTAKTRLRRALELRLTRDIRRLDYVGPVRPVGRQDFRRRVGHAADPGRWRRAHRAATASARFERLRAAAVRRASPSGRRRRAARAGSARGLRPAGDRAEGDGDRPAADGPRSSSAIGAVFALRASRRFEAFTARSSAS